MIKKSILFLVFSSFISISMVSFANSEYTINIKNNAPADSGYNFVYSTEGTYAVSPATGDSAYKSTPLTPGMQAAPYFTLTAEGDGAQLSGNVALNPSVNGIVQTNIYCNVSVYKNKPLVSCSSGCVCMVQSYNNTSMTVYIDYQPQSKEG